MTRTRCKIAVTSVALAFGVTSLLASSPAQAASNAAEIQQALAPTVGAISSGGPNAYYNTWLRYVGQGSPKPGFGDEYVILGKGEKGSLDRSYSYSYIYSAQFDQKRPSKVMRQGIAPSTELGGSWMRRGDLTGFLPAAVNRLRDDTIVTNLQTNRSLGRQVARIAGQTPEEKAISMVDLGTTYPVREGSLQRNVNPLGVTTYQWQTGAYTNSWGDSCDGSTVIAYLQATPSGAQLSNFDVNETNCRTSDGQPVATYNDGSVRPWNAIVGNAPEPNVSLAN